MLYNKLFQRREQKKLLSHPIFNKMNYWKSVQINRIEITNLAKKNMIKVFLRLYITQFQLILNDFIESESYKEPEAIVPLYLDAFDKIHRSALLQCIPEIFLDKYSELERDHLNGIYTDIDNVMSSNFYKSYMDKTTAILDIFMYHFVFIILNSEKSLNQLNGQMERALVNTVFNTEK